MAMLDLGRVGDRFARVCRWVAETEGPNYLGVAVS